MKNNKIQDERILSVRRKIQSEAYGWLVWVLMISIFIQHFFMKAPFAQYAVEFFSLIGCGLYILIRHFKEGIDIWSPKDDGKKKSLLSTIISTVILAVVLIIVFTLTSGEYDIKFLISYLVGFVIFFFGTRLGIIAINKKKQQAIETKLNEDEMNK